MKQVDTQLGAVARPSRVYFVTVLPKARNGKLLRRALKAVAERRDPGDLTTHGRPRRAAAGPKTWWVIDGPDSPAAGQRPGLPWLGFCQKILSKTIAASA